jgi:VanZ family protein
MRLFSFLLQNIILNRAAFYSALLLGSLLAFIPADGGIQANFNDKLLHIVGFFVMAFLAHIAHPAIRYLYLIIGLSCFGLMIEIVQAYLPYRSFSVWDWWADVFGMLLYFLLIAPMINHLMMKRKCALD